MEALNQESFDRLIYDEEIPCLVIFSRKSCHVCQAVKPKLAELEEDYADRFGFYSVDVEEEADLFARFSMKGVPQVLFFQDGSFVKKLAGEKDYEVYEDEIRRILENE